MTDECEKKGFAIASFVLGIVSIVLFFIPLLPLLTAVLAIIFGGVSLHAKESGRGFAIAGLVLGIIMLVFYVLVIIIAGLSFAAVVSNVTILTPTAAAGPAV